MIHRILRIGAVARVPLLCDPTLQARMLVSAVKATPAVDADGAPLGDEAHAQAVHEHAESRRERFRETMDPAHLEVPIDGVTHVTVRILDGAAQAEAWLDVSGRGVVQPDEKQLFNRTVGIELARRCIVAIDGNPAVPVQDSGGVLRYPYAALREMTNMDAIVNEANRAQATLGTLGEWPASVCAPQSDATRSEGAEGMPTLTAVDAPASPTDLGTASGTTPKRGA